MSIYDPWIDGEWEAVSGQDLWLACCDCGLVHKMDFRSRNGKIEMRVERHDRATAGIRRGQEIGRQLLEMALKRWSG